MSIEQLLQMSTDRTDRLNITGFVTYSTVQYSTVQYSTGNSNKTKFTNN